MKLLKLSLPFLSLEFGLFLFQPFDSCWREPVLTFAEFGFVNPVGEMTRFTHLQSNSFWICNPLTLAKHSSKWDYGDTLMNFVLENWTRVIFTRSSRDWNWSRFTNDSLVDPLEISVRLLHQVRRSGAGLAIIMCAGNKRDSSGNNRLGKKWWKSGTSSSQENYNFKRIFAWRQVSRATIIFRWEIIDLCVLLSVAKVSVNGCLCTFTCALNGTNENKCRWWRSVAASEFPRKEGMVAHYSQ